nr:class 1 fructose-bisphosphatase [Anaerolineae bacterium]
MPGTKLITIERHILEQQARFPHATGEFTSLLYDIALAAKLISRETNRAGLANILGKAGTQNVQGEQQELLDVYANQIIVRMLNHTGRVCIMASEEDPDPIFIPATYKRGNYVVLFDPLDGSSNIDYNVSVGTIFSIHRHVTPDLYDCGLPDLLQPGRRLVAAGYIVYGSSTMMVYSAGNGVAGFTLDPSVGEFLLSHEEIRAPDNPKYYSVNQGYERFWLEAVRQYVKWITGMKEDEPRKALSARYIGSMVSDFHRNLIAGGIFLYPADTRDKARPMGKLRLNYECAPLAYIMEQAGGAASDGIHRILDIVPQSLHQRTPFFCGNKDLVAKMEEYFQHYNPEWVEALQERVQLVT